MVEYGVGMDNVFVVFEKVVVKDVDELVGIFWFIMGCNGGVDVCRDLFLGVFF